MLRLFLSHIYQVIFSAMITNAFSIPYKWDSHFSKFIELIYYRSILLNINYDISFLLLFLIKAIKSFLVTLK